MKHDSDNHLAIIVHGFAGKTGFMDEIEETLRNPPYNKKYNQVENISVYNSPHGLDLSQPYDLVTPIYDENTTQTLAHYFLSQICTVLEKLEKEENTTLDIYAHSMGGLVTRSMVKYLLNDKRFTASIKTIFLLGTPNKGTRLAQRTLNVSADIFMHGLNLLFELPHGGISEVDRQILNSQFMQMVPNSLFLRKLNKRSEIIEKSINWVTVRGLKFTGQLGMFWQPFLFSRFWIDRYFPFLHTGMIPNDGFVEAQSVPLKYATNLTVPSATHMDLLKWKTKQPGIKVQTLLKPIILAE
ncbi:MAG: esterase/lipase family protein [Candidatus Hodarchaeales archaeon]|jgi:hypothetical protein